MFVLELVRDMQMKSPPLKLYARKGERPETDKQAPHTQLTQLPPLPSRQKLSQVIVKRLAEAPDVTIGGSRRAPPGSIGFHLNPSKASRNERAFLLGTEIAHVHADDDGSLHAILPEPTRTQAIELGWAEPHPFAGMPTVSLDTVMLYAPRDEDEVDVVVSLIHAGLANARH